MLITINYAIFNKILSFIKEQSNSLLLKNVSKLIKFLYPNNLKNNTSTYLSILLEIY